MRCVEGSTTHRCLVAPTVDLEPSCVRCVGAVYVGVITDPSGPSLPPLALDRRSLWRGYGVPVSGTSHEEIPTGAFCCRCGGGRPFVHREWWCYKSLIANLEILHENMVKNFTVKQTPNPCRVSGVFGAPYCAHRPFHPPSAHLLVFSLSRSSDQELFRHTTGPSECGTGASGSTGDGALRPVEGRLGCPPPAPAAETSPGSRDLGLRWAPVVDEMRLPSTVSDHHQDP